RRSRKRCWLSTVRVDESVSKSNFKTRVRACRGDGVRGSYRATGTGGNCFGRRWSGGGIGHTEHADPSSFLFGCDAIGRPPAVSARTLHGVVAARVSVQSLCKSGDVHSAVRRIVLQAWKDDAARRQIHSGCEHHGAAPGRKHEHAPGSVSAI